MKRWFWIAVTVAVLPLLAEAGRPLTVDDAGTVAHGDAQIEAGVGGDADVLHDGLVLRWQANEWLELVSEVFADTLLGAGNNAAVTFNGGLRWQIIDGLVLDAAAGVGLRGDATDSTATVGLMGTFGLTNPSNTTGQ